MAILERYDPAKAFKNPTAYYEQAFRENVPVEKTVNRVGRAASFLSQPRFHFIEGVTAASYFADVSPDDRVIITLSHKGKQRLHDISGGAAAVFKQPVLRRRIPKMRIWAAVSYLKGRQGEVLSDLGIIPTIRYKDLLKLGLGHVTPEQTEPVNHAMFDTSVDFLCEEPGRTLDIFPAGEKGADALKAGVAHVASRVPGVLIMPISMTSPREQSGRFMGNMPLGMEVVYGAIQEVSSTDTVESIVANLQQAHDDAYEIALRHCNDR